MVDAGRSHNPYVEPNAALPDKHRTDAKTGPKNKNTNFGTVSGKTNENTLNKKEAQAKAGGPQEKTKQSLVFFSRRPGYDLAKFG